MARLNVNPTRMELKKVKTRYATAERGHKLLKDKTDEMIRKFTAILKENKELREAVEKDIENVMKEFSKAKTLLSNNEIELAFSMPSYKAELDCKVKSELNIEVPVIELKQETQKELPYSVIEFTSEVDNSANKIIEIMPKLIRLAQVEKTMMLMSAEIEKSKRRVNALENIIMPQCEETIKYIEMKLDENERGNITRLMKVKDIIKE